MSKGFVVIPAIVGFLVLEGVIGGIMATYTPDKKASLLVPVGPKCYPTILTAPAKEWPPYYKVDCSWRLNDGM